VTDEETIRLLRQHGVDYAQGVFVGPPALVQSRSTSIAIPIPPATHIDSIP
jgi:EAL domain-containing protein (putative c-di-GMP-specific phosphodiesterase class I)